MFNYYYYFYRRKQERTAVVHDAAKKQNIVFDSWRKVCYVVACGSVFVSVFLDVCFVASACVGLYLIVCLHVFTVFVCPNVNLRMPCVHICLFLFVYVFMFEVFTLSL